MHILHIISTLDPEAGGPSELVRAMLDFAPHGYTGEVVTQDDPDADFIRGFPHPVHALGPKTSNFGYSPKLLRWLKNNRERFDGVMLNGLWGYEGIATRRAFRGHKPYIVISHGMLKPTPTTGPWVKRAKARMYWLLCEYWNLRAADQVLFATQAEADFARQDFRPHQWNGLVISFGSQRPPAGGPALQSSFYWRFPAMRDRSILLFLGCIHPENGCDLLIRSFLKFAAKDPSLHLMMAGSDEQGWSAELQRIVNAAGLSHRVHWPGALTGDVKWGALFAADALILPSHQENYGVAVAEALSSGCPVLLSDKVNISAEVAAAGAGLMEADTQEGTDNLIRRWMETPASDRSAMCIRALELFDLQYDMRRSAATLYHLFGEPAPNAADLLPKRLVG